MDKFIPLPSMFKKINEKKYFMFLDKLSFLNILLIWIFILIMFGFIYYFFSNATSYLIYSSTGQKVSLLSDNIYYSFITATSTGFGDIIPKGYFKPMGIVEVIFGLILLALVTSKFISLKQNVIINEIYEISFNDHINKIRSSLLLFRQNLVRIINKIEENIIKKRDLSELYSNISSFDDVLNEINWLFERSKKK